MKSLEEFLSFIECFPSSISAAIGNGWKPSDVLDIAIDIRANANLQKISTQKHGMGAIDPNADVRLGERWHREK